MTPLDHLSPATTTLD
jgi:hypothetical protein